MFSLNCKGRLLLVDKPLVMGIINATPDSFFEGSRSNGIDEILIQAEKMIVDGADIIDIGGQSTRPGSKRIAWEEELKRVIKGIEAIHNKFPEIIISIDTYYSKVARACVDAGAAMVNDISAGNLDAEMIQTVADLKVPYIIMHMKGTPESMNQYATYENASREVLDFFITKKDDCRKAGIHDLIIDPGFGFAKTIDHNFELLRNLSLFKMLESPVLIGISRKSSVYKPLGISSAEALNGTTVLNTIAMMNGANILRVHDVKEAKEAVKLFGLLQGG
ncbi:MAG TPA: dihydropteroate synthase [Chitinophagaceae bacterium]|nr:dihydropteroate synthase [Chitinophagaceae bacterium]